MKNECIEFAMLSERVYRTFLELIKHELDVAGISDINPIQAAVLLNIDENTMEEFKEFTANFAKWDKHSTKVRIKTSGKMIKWFEERVA